MYNETESTSNIINGIILDEDGNTIVYMQAQKTYNNDVGKSSISANIMIQNYEKYLENQKEYDSNIDKFKLRVTRL
jgi:hypothetical protein